MRSLNPPEQPMKKNASVFIQRFRSFSHFTVHVGQHAPRPIHSSPWQLARGQRLGLLLEAAAAAVDCQSAGVDRSQCFYHLNHPSSPRAWMADGVFLLAPGFIKAKEDHVFLSPSVLSVRAAQISRTHSINQLPGRSAEHACPPSCILPGESLRREAVAINHR